MRNMGFTGSSEVKNLPVTQETAHSAGDVGLIPQPGRFPEKEKATQSCILAWKIPWTEEHGGYSPWGVRVDQVGFISGMQGFFNICKPINVIHHMDKLKKRSYHLNGYRKSL